MEGTKSDDECPNRFSNCGEMEDEVWQETEGKTDQQLGWRSAAGDMTNEDGGYMMMSCEVVLSIPHMLDCAYPRRTFSR